MNVRLSLALFAALALLQSVSLLPAAAEGLVPADSLSAAVKPSPASPQPCPANTANPAQIAQMDCCKGHKGICGCRAGKIVCCDGTVSKEPNCTCHGDDGIDN